MTRDQIDVVWQQAMHDAIADGEQMTRYHFAAMVSAIQRQRDAEIARAWDVARPESNYGRCIGRLIEQEGGAARAVDAAAEAAAAAAAARAARAASGGTRTAAEEKAAETDFWAQVDPVETLRRLVDVRGGEA